MEQDLNLAVSIMMLALFAVITSMLIAIKNFGMNTPKDKSQN